MRYYFNYHRHSNKSTICAPLDVQCSNEDYAKRAVELGHKSISSLEHGFGGDIFEIYTLAQKYNLKPIFAIEGYIVPSLTLEDGEKDKSNFHFVIIPKTNEARKKVNLLNSKAHIENYYYKPRWTRDMLLSLTPDDVYVTSACVGGLLRDERSIDELFLPAAEHFKDSFFVEVQSHDDDKQRLINATAIELAERLGLKLIAGCDSHYIDENGKQLRGLIRPKFGKKKDDAESAEDNFVLDYPDGDTLFERFQHQGVLTDAQIKEAIASTVLIEKSVEALYVDSSIRIPNIHKELDEKQRFDLLKSMINQRFKKIIEDEHLSKEEIKERVDGIRYELDIIEKTQEVHSADYFIYVTEMVERAVNKYGGVITRTGRGSAASFYISRCIGVSQIDRFTYKNDIPLVPERFLSVERAIKSHSLADFDLNIVDVNPFLQSARDLCGENSVYPMLAWGTLQELAAFKTVCRYRDVPASVANDLSGNLDATSKDKTYGKYVEESAPLVGTITSVSPHPCSYLIYDIDDIRSEFGVVRVGDQDKKSYSYCVPLTSGEADAFGLCKFDFLIVSVWKLISETFKSIGKDIISVKSLIDATKNDPRIWKLFSDGITATLNQVDSVNGREKAMAYKPESEVELAALCAAIRPSFNELRDSWIKRVPNSFGVGSVDDLFKNQNGYILYQENLLQFFSFLGMTPEEAIITLKKINKKRMDEASFARLEADMKKVWIDKTQTPTEEFDRVWALLQSYLAYGFCSAHALSVGIDALFGAYLKVNFPLEYYTVCLNEYAGDTEETAKLASELSYFGISLKPSDFRHISEDYVFDAKTRTIYKSIAAYKYINKGTAKLLQQLSNKTYPWFLNLYIDMKGLGVDRKKIEVLIKLGLFENEFGETNHLLAIMNLCDEFEGAKLIKKTKLTNLGIREDIVRRFAIKESDTQFKVEPMMIPEILWEIYNLTPIESASISDKIRWQIEFSGSCDIKSEQFDPRYAVVIDIDVDRSNPLVKIQQLNSGKQSTIKVRKKKLWKDKTEWTQFNDVPFSAGDVLYVDKYVQLNKPMLKDGQWIETDVKEWFIKRYTKANI